MGWIDRSYSRSDFERGGLNGVLLWLATGSLSLGTWFGIRVRVHISLLAFIIFSLISSAFRGGMRPQDALISVTIVFVSVLLHEFGHCFAARYVGGDADEILLWPLGGLAFIRTPQRPWPSFIGTAGGPMVNLAICIITATGIKLLTGWDTRLPLNPLLPFTGNVVYFDISFIRIYFHPVAYYLWWIYIINFGQFCFNLLPIFPLDGGRIFQTILWPRLGYAHAMDIACTVGMAGAVILGLIGLMSNGFLLILAMCGFLTCYQTRMNLQADGWEADAYQVSRGSGRQKTPRPQRPPDDAFSIKDLNPFERIARARRKKQFERLMRDD